MGKTKNKHGRKGIKATSREVPGTKDNLYARLASAEGQIDTLRGTVVRLETALQDIIEATLGSRTGAGKRARELAEAVLDATANRY